MGDAIVEMVRGDGRLVDARREPAARPAQGLDYGFLLDDDGHAPTRPAVAAAAGGRPPASRTFDPPASPGPTQRWTGRQLAGAVIYELHVGTFTPEGTLDAALGRLDHLRELGVDFVELMPVNAFNGTHNWGYDGVLWFAVDEPYGGPDGLPAVRRRLPRRRPRRDPGRRLQPPRPVGQLPAAVRPVPQGAARNTWGDLVNLDGRARPRCGATSSTTSGCGSRTTTSTGCASTPCTRSTTPPTHLLEEMAIEVAALSAHLRRPLTLIAESDLNDPVLVTPREAGGYGLDAQWSDDFHHAVHVALTGETHGYYADFEPLARAGQGVRARVLPRRHLLVVPRARPRRADRHRGDADVAAGGLQPEPRPDRQPRRRRPDHRALDDDQLACAALLTLCGPFTPMLFQGEEWAASTPFQFFTSHPEPELGQATAEGRIAEFAKMGWDPAVVPDPQDPATFDRSKLDWSELDVRPRAADARRLPRAGAAAPRAPRPHRPGVRRTSARVDEAAPVLRDAPRRAAGAGQLRRRSRRPPRWARSSCSSRPSRASELADGGVLTPAAPTPAPLACGLVTGD